jgi:hypothetical protein
MEDEFELFGERHQIEEEQRQQMLAEKVECQNCKWQGTEDDLLMDFYEEQNSPMPIATICPNCKSET